MMTDYAYGKYRLSKTVTISQIVSADYIVDTKPRPFFHSHEDAWELCYCVSGLIYLHRESQAAALHEGEIAFVRPKVSHYIEMPEQEDVAFIISFTCTNDSIRLLQDNVFAASCEQRDLFAATVRELSQAFDLNAGKLRLLKFEPSKDSPFGAEQLICCYLEQIIILLLREITRQDGQLIKNKHFAKAIGNYLADNVNAYIQAHIGENLTVGQIARQFRYSRTRLSTLYKAATGMGINESISAEKIAQAKKLLCDGSLTVAQISAELGFTSAPYFSRKFTRETGCAPSRYAAREGRRS